MLADTIAAMLGILPLEELKRRIEEYDAEMGTKSLPNDEEQEARETANEAMTEESDETRDKLDLLYCIFIVAQLFEDLMAVYPDLRADLRQRVDELWAMIDMLKTRWTGVGLPTEPEV
jgi:oligoendopeptidase F